MSAPEVLIEKHIGRLGRRMPPKFDCAGLTVQQCQDRRLTVLAGSVYYRHSGSPKAPLSKAQRPSSEQPAHDPHHLDVTPDPSPAVLHDPLTEREMAVLRFLPTALSQREIASEHYGPLNTVKTHCQAIYRKLGVSDRKAAIQTARDHHLLYSAAPGQCDRVGPAGSTRSR